MKQVTLILLISFFSLNVIGQEVTTEVKKQKKEKVRLDKGPAVYITTSTGINNNTAILGFNFELPVSPKVTIDAGPGTGTWNYKAYLGAKVYLKPAQRGFAFGTGFTYATGTRGNSYEMTTINGDKEQLKFNKNPQTNIFFAAYKYWNLGRQYNRLYLELGWSVPLSGGDKVTQMSGPPVTDESKRALESMAPGGPILAFGFSFGVH